MVASAAAPPDDHAPIDETAVTVARGPVISQEEALHMLDVDSETFQDMVDVHNGASVSPTPSPPDLDSDHMTDGGVQLGVDEHWPPVARERRMPVIQERSFPRGRVTGRRRRRPASPEVGFESDREQQLAEFMEVAVSESAPDEDDVS
jgi:hypothetical protein